MADFDLEPLPAAAFLVATRPPLRQNSFQLFVARNFKQRLALRLVMIRVAQRITRLEDLAQLPLAVLQIDPPPVVAVEINQVKRVIENRNICLRHRFLSARAGIRFAVASG